ncbi:hypothetical protein A2U01_0002536 [Trifolium medium]|uniref:Uncharacterized protein n=1 Tax=Trifolium medium TaxID=97028 RepID=A0A392M5S6_9FABA|nr:hypothetical protein [Trifolium medium]
MCRRDWGVGGGGWSWRRPLFVWEEEMLEGCCGLFYNFVLQLNVIDKWLWRSLHSDVFTVKGAYQSLTRVEEWLGIQGAFHNNQVVHAHHFIGLQIQWYFKLNYMFGGGSG